MNSLRSKNKGCLIVLTVLATLVAVSIIIMVVGEHQIGLKMTHDKRLVKASLLSTLPIIESFEKGSDVKNAMRLRGLIVDHLKNESIQGFLVCNATESDDPLVVYEGPLMQPYVMVLFRFGGITQWSMDDWMKDPHRKTAIEVRR